MDENQCRIRYLPVAVRDMEEIFDYICQDNREAALKLLDKMDESIFKLSNLPFIGPIPKDIHLENKGYRILIVEEYLIFYVVKENAVEIRRILHGKRRYSFLL